MTVFFTVSLSLVVASTSMYEVVLPSVGTGTEFRSFSSVKDLGGRSAAQKYCSMVGQRSGYTGAGFAAALVRAICWFSPEGKEGT